MRGKINFLGSNTAVRDHRSMQLGNGLAAGFDEHEWKEGVDKTSPGTQQHLAAEPGSPQQMSPVGLPDRGRMFGKEALNIHVYRLGP